MDAFSLHLSLDVVITIGSQAPKHYGYDTYTLLNVR